MMSKLFVLLLTGLLATSDARYVNANTRAGASKIGASKVTKSGVDKFQMMLPSDKADVLMMDSMMLPLAPSREPEPAKKSSSPINELAEFYGAGFLDFFSP